MQFAHSYSPFPNSKMARQYADPVVAVRANLHLDADAVTDVAELEKKLEKVECKIYYRNNNDGTDNHQSETFRSLLQDGTARAKKSRIVQNMRHKTYNVENQFANV